MAAIVDYMRRQRALANYLEKRIGQWVTFSYAPGILGATNNGEYGGDIDTNLLDDSARAFLNTNSPCHYFVVSACHTTLVLRKLELEDLFFVRSKYIYTFSGTKQKNEQRRENGLYSRSGQILTVSRIEKFYEHEPYALALYKQVLAQLKKQ